MRSTFGAVIALAIFASACGGPDSPASSSEDELRWRWCRSKTICRVPHTWWRYCADPSSDPRNCGGCGIRCDRGEACVSGVCTGTCGAGLVGCANGCTDISSDPANCGGCGVACSDGQVCQNSQCTNVCPGGQTNCGGPDAIACTDTQTDAANCGTCGITCQADEVCVNGGCTALCNGDTFCTSGGVSYCTNTQVDSGNCGTCGNVCTGGTSCDGGTCVCPSGYADCGAGCQDVQSDRQNCGGCGVTCADNQVCQAGVCTLWCGSQTRCQVGGVDSCVDTSIDAQNCGACGNACGTDITCVSGQCAPCATNLTSCGDTCVNVATDPSNCGGCGNACGAGQTCVGGGCVTPPSGNSFEASVTFDEATSVAFTTMASDAPASLWSGGQRLSSGASNFTHYDGVTGSVLAGTPCFVTMDNRGIFSPGGSGQVYARLAGTAFVYRMNGCSTPTLSTTLGAPNDLPVGVTWSWGNNFGTAMTADTQTIVVMWNGVVYRWSSTGTYLGSTPLAGWGDQAGETLAAQSLRVAVAGSSYLTYSNGFLSVWSADGTRLRTVELVGAGTSVESHYSLSFADGLVWIRDDLGGIWRGYMVGL